MLSRARALLEEGKPSLALQAVRLSLPSSFLVPSPFHVLCVWRVALVSTIAGSGAGRGEFTGLCRLSYPSRDDQSLG
jgi:hypothetical protein